MRKPLPFLFIFMSAILASCVQNTTEDSTENTNSLIHPADNPPAEKVAIPEIKGTVYHFNELINKSDCELTHKEDSTGWDLVFIDDSQFVEAFYFPSDISIKKGKYHWENDSLQLDYDSVRISRVYAKITSTTDELMKGQDIKKIPVTISNKKEYGSARIEKLSLRKCDNGTVYMAWHNLTLTQIMPEDNGVKMNITADDYKEQMKKDGTWDLLFPKSK
jgi:hypothetical protein